MNALILFLLLGLPLIVWPLGPSPFELPKVLVFELLTAVLLVIHFVQNPSLPKELFLRKSNLPFFIIFLLSIAHLLVEPTAYTLFGNPFRLQGVFLLWTLMLFALLAHHQTLRVPWFVPTITLIVLTTSAFFWSDSVTGRAVGTLGQPNYLGAVAIFIWPFLYFGVKHKLHLLAPLLVVPLLVLSESRAAFIAFILQILFLALSKKVSLSKAAVVALFVLMLTFSLPFFEGENSAENRSQIWISALTVNSTQSLPRALLHSLVGYGFGNTEFPLQERTRNFENLRVSYIDSSHNIFLDWWIQAGILGLGALLLLIFRSFRSFITHNQTLETTLFLGLLAVLSFNPLSIATLVQFWWLIGHSNNKS